MYKNLFVDLQNFHYFYFYFVENKCIVFFFFSKNPKIHVLMYFPCICTGLKASFYKRLTLNLLLPPEVTYRHDHVQVSNAQTLSLLDLHYTSTHTCNFEIPLKGLATQTLQFVTPRPPLKV